MTRITETVYTTHIVGGQFQEVIDIYHSEPKKTWGGGYGDRFLMVRAVWINGEAFQFSGGRNPDALWRLRDKKRKELNKWMAR